MRLNEIQIKRFIRKIIRENMNNLPDSFKPRIVDNDFRNTSHGTQILKNLDDAINLGSVHKMLK